MTVKMSIHNVEVFRLRDILLRAGDCFRSFRTESFRLPTMEGIGRSCSSTSEFVDFMLSEVAEPLSVVESFN
jgi:hypothetical protein